MVDLRAFFGEGNAISDSVLTDAGSTEARRLRVFLDAADRGAGVVALPRLVGTGAGSSVLYWYVFWGVDGLERLVCDTLRAFVGPSYSDMGYWPARLSASDSFDSRFAGEVTGAQGVRAFKFRVRLEDGRRVSERLARYIELVNRRPLRRTPRVRPVGRVLRDFDFALLQERASEAKGCLEELRSLQYLDAQNLTYLELRYLSRFGRFGAVLSHTGLQDALRIGAPRGVAESILVCLYEEKLRSEAEAGNVDGVVAAAAEEVAVRFQALLSTRRAALDPRALVTFLAGKLALERPEPNAEEMVQGVRTGFAGSKVLEGLVARFAGRVVPDGEASPMAVAREAFDDADIDAAVSELQKCPPSLASTRLAFQCALETREPRLAEFALSRLEELPAAGQETFSQSVHWNRRVTTLRALLGVTEASERDEATEFDAVPSAAVRGWVDWFGRLCGDSEWPSAVAVLQSGAGEWSFEVFREEGALESVLECLDRLPKWAEATLHRAMPTLVDAFLLKDNTGDRARGLRPVLDRFYEYLFFDDHPSVPSCAAMGEVLLPVVEGGLPEETYQERLDLFSEVLRRCGAPGTVAIGLDAINSLLLLPCPSPEARMAFVMKVGNLALQHWGRLRREEQDYCRSLLSEVAPELSLPEREAAQHGQDWSRLSGRYVAMYSLQEAAMKRAAAVLRGLVPEIRVEAYATTVGGDPRLRAAARSADLFVIVTRAATHAATEFIEAERSGDIERPVGVGTASILSAVARWRDNLAD